jgi:anion-transporting  ArsA/GET3 family ATPase
VSRGQDQKIVFVTGKGGVGKSMLAFATAQKFAEEGKNTLLVELGDKSFYHYVFGQKFAHEPLKFQENLSICRWDGEGCLREYLLHYIRIEKIVNLFYENPVSKALVHAAPALRELAILGKITSGIRKIGPSLNFDRIVVDGFATGHFKAMLMAPIGMAEAIGFGPMGEQSRLMTGVVRNKDICQFLVVTLPEELPVAETLELSTFLKEQTGQSPKIFLNKIWTPDLSLDQIKKLKAKANTEFLKLVESHLKQQAEYKNILKENKLEIEELPMVWDEEFSGVATALSSLIKGPQ